MAARRLCEVPPLRPVEDRPERRGDRRLRDQPRLAGRHHVPRHAAVAPAHLRRGLRARPARQPAAARGACRTATGPDANVFGIEQGVAIVLLVKTGRACRAGSSGPTCAGTAPTSSAGWRATTWSRPPGPRWSRRGPPGCSSAAMRRSRRSTAAACRCRRSSRSSRPASSPAGTPWSPTWTRSACASGCEDFRRELTLREAGGGRGSSRAWRLSTERLRRAREDTAWEERFTTFLFRPFDVRHLFAAE